MPYYCTVPRCTSMAGKAKNVSFHQFPRDEELATLWNKILKRGKPYTKYSKVCSLHFRPEDYTITSVGKNRGQWRTLRKDAVPSQNLPLDVPPYPYHHRTRSSGSWDPSNGPQNTLDSQVTTFSTIPPDDNPEMGSDLPKSIKRPKHASFKKDTLSWNDFFS